VPVALPGGAVRATPMVVRVFTSSDHGDVEDLVIVTI
jgi:hypothetical protein